MSKKKLVRITSVAVLAVAVMLSLFGCSSKSTLDADAPSDSQMTVSATPTSINTHETSVVEATVIAEGAGVSSQVVHFTVSPSSAGSFTPEYDTTDASGVAAAIFTATSSGTATVLATVQGTTITSSINLSVSESSQQGTGNINVTVSRSLLLANGQDSSQVTVVVTDDLAQPAPDSTLIKVTAGEKFVDNDGNGYWSEGIDSLVFDANGNGQWDPIGLIPSTAWTSGGNGTAILDYVAGDDAYTVYIKVTVDDGGIVGTAEVSIQLSPNATLSSIYLASESLSLSVRGTGGIETGLLRATGYDVNGNPVPEGMQIVFAILDGPGGGEQLDEVGYGPDTAVTNSQGVATSTLHSGTASGTVRIRAYSGAILSNATQVLISAGPPAYIAIGAQSCNVPFWDNVGEFNSVIAVVSDVYLNPVNDSTVVYFATDEGTMVSHQGRTKDGQGIATSTWIAGNNVGSADGQVYFYAETAGGTVADTCMFYNSHYPDTLIVVGMPTTILADGKSEVTVGVIGLDLNGNPVVGGTQFDGEANYLSVGGGVLEDGCYSSSDRVKIYSALLDLDYSRDLVTGNDDGVGAIDYVEYRYADLTKSSFACSLMTGPAYGGNSSITGPTSAKPGEQIRFSATIKDRWGNPLADHTLQMTATGGVVTGGSQESDPYGEAYGFIWTAPALEDSYNIVITDTDPRGSGLVLSVNVAVSAS
jgi:hypothetical protein